MTLWPDPHTEIREALEAAIALDNEWWNSEHSEALPALARLEREAAERETARRREPSDEGGPGKEETYWLRAKLDAAVTHLRDIEDFYRLRGGTPESPNQVRADRARQLYEAIISDFRDGKMYRPTIRERAEAAEARVREVEAERDRNARAYEAAKITAECGLQHADLLRMDTAEDEAARKLIVATIQKGLSVAAVLASPEAAATEPRDEHLRLQAIREAAWNVVIENQPVLLGTVEDTLYRLLCEYDHDFGGTALPAVDAPPRALVCPKCGSEIDPKETRTYSGTIIEAFCTTCKRYSSHRAVDAPPETTT